MMTPSEIKEARLNSYLSSDDAIGIRVTNIHTGQEKTAACHGVWAWATANMLTPANPLIRFTYNDRASRMMNTKRHEIVDEYVHELFTLFGEWLESDYRGAWSETETSVSVCFDMSDLPGGVFLSIANTFRSINENITLPFMWKFLKETHPELNAAQRLMIAGALIPKVETSGHMYTSSSSGKNLNQLRNFSHFRQLRITCPPMVVWKSFSIAGISAMQQMLPYECRTGYDCLAPTQYSPENVKALLEGSLYKKGEW